MGIRYGSDDIPVLVFQVGKVGSSTVYYSLINAGIRCEHVHRISPENIKRIADDRRQRGLPVKDERLGLALNGRLKRANEKVRIITMVREPVGRNISAFFQNLADCYGKVPLHLIPVEEAIRRFFDEYPHHIVLEWFEAELERVTGVSLYDQPFPHQKQWMIIHEGRFEILVLRVEAPDNIKSEAIKTFLNLPSIDLVRANVGDVKVYARLYEEFRTRISLPEEYLNTMLESKYARHFYSVDEIAGIRASYSDGGGSNNAGVAGVRGHECA